MNRLPIFIRGQLIYCAIDGNVISGSMMGLDKNGLIHIETKEKIIAACHISQCYGNEYCARVRAHGIGSRVFFYPMTENNERLYTSKIIDFEDYFIRHEGRSEKKLMVVIECEMGVISDEIFITKEQAISGSILIDFKEDKDVFIETISNYDSEFGMVFKTISSKICKSDHRIIQHLN